MRSVRNTLLFDRSSTKMCKTHPTKTWKKYNEKYNVRMSYKLENSFAPVCGVIPYGY